jgi:hypothetical protein
MVTGITCRRQVISQPSNQWCLRANNHQANILLFTKLDYLHLPTKTKIVDHGRIGRWPEYAMHQNTKSTHL